MMIGNNQANQTPDPTIRPLDGRLQADPQLREGPAGTGRIILSIVAVAIVIGGVVYGLTRPDVLHDAALQGTTPQIQQARKDADKSSDLPEFNNVPATFSPKPDQTTGAAAR